MLEPIPQPMRSLYSLILTLAGLFTPTLLPAQTYYYIDNISVSPPAPTTSDPITITVIGNLSSSNAMIVSASHSVVGSTVYLDIVAAAPGIGLPVLTPHNETFNIGTLPAGNYIISIGGTGVFDGAPSPEHLFTVSGADTPCDSMVVDLVQWSTFSDTALVVQLTNYGSSQFNYPGFIILDSGGDTVAVESVNLFAIIPGSTSTHIVTVHPTASIPSGPITLSLELWTGYYTLQECEFDWTGDLCPAGPCVEIHPLVTPTSLANFPVTIPWALYDDGLNTVASGTFSLSGPFSQGTDTICLPAGEYIFSTDPTLTPDSTIHTMIMGPGWSSTQQGYNVNDGYPEFFDFTLYEQCIDSTNALGDPPSIAGLLAFTTNGVLHVTGRSGLALGLLRLFSADGRLVRSHRLTGDRAVIAVEDLAPGVYLLHGTQGAIRVVVGGQ